MKLTFALLIVGLLNANAKSFSQTVTFSGRNVTLDKVFGVIEAQTGYTIFANKGLLQGVKPVTVDAKNMPIRDFLTIALKDQPIDFVIENRTIFIKEKVSAGPAALAAADLPPPPIKITGTVVSAEGVPLQGATILVKGTHASAMTDDKGNFVIEAGSSATLAVSFVGYQSQEIPVKGRASINIVLQKALAELNQVVVTALGIKRQTKALTYNVQEVDGAEVNNVKDANFVNGLTGKVAGVTINTASSGIGGSVRVVMRGAKSLTGNNNALYVVDGIPLPNLTTTQAADIFSGAGATGDGISNINPDDIASISVLTGPAAAALYGNQAANGVILVTTKKGAAGKLNVNVTNNTNFFTPFVLPQFQNTYGSAQGDFSSWGEKLKTPTSYDPKDFFNTGYNATEAINVSTGTDKNQTYLSAARVDGGGIIPGNTLSRNNFSLRNTSTFLDDKLSLDLGAAYINVTEQNMLSQGQYFNPLIPIYLFPRGDDIEKYKIYERYDATRNFKTQYWPYGDEGFQMQNPYWIINRDFFVNHKDRYVMNAAAKYNVNSWINVTARVKLDNNTTVGERKYYASTSGLFASKAGAYYRATTGTKQLYADVLLNINRELTRDVRLNVNIGSSYLDTKYNAESYGGNLLSVPNLFNFTNVNQSLATVLQDGYHDQSQAVYGSAELSWRNAVFLDFTGRNDWSSALVNTTASHIFYPSVGGSAVLSDLFKIHSPVLSFLKVRGSYSEVGNPPQRFITIETYPIQGGFPVTSSYMPAVGLQPERTKSTEAGFNAKFLRNHLSFDVTAYQSNTYNQLFNPSLAPSTGYSSFYINAGQVTNKGIEATLSYSGQVARGLEWTSSATFTLNRNKIVKLLSSYTDKTTGQTVSVDSLNVGGTGSYEMSLVKGGSIGDIYVTTLQTDEHGYVFVNFANRTVLADPNNTYVKAGNANPRYNLGFRNSFTYKNFNLSFLVTARIGGVGVSVTQAIMDRFGVSKASADARDAGGVKVNGYLIPAQPYYQVVGGGVAGIGSTYVYSATNVRLGEASLGYEFPAAFFKNKIQGVTLALTGRNLFMFYNKAPFDPEATASTSTYWQGIDYFMQPSLRSFGFSVKVKL
ncbi:MAG: SusC/RagA family TonB-linked outer membrane protein [Bacteroidetes bacterium]|nr:SusC/RagA family TonB-linked outer membrane protein [Bacteroidota bacterium]